ncbi:DMT family transporter [Actinocorallia longicatena]|uniref:EamA family transporter n=1 Tax=Actinocorallia longicatena TaxID=111803 RepID=A0ABP6Q3Y9_9ACTN
MRIPLMYTLVTVIWGTNWIAIKAAAVDLGPLLASGLRFLVAVPVLVTLCLVLRVPLVFPRGLGWFGAFATVGYFGVPFLLLNLAETGISSGLAALCFAMESVIIVFLSKPMLGTALRPVQIIGVLTACAALLLLVSDVSASSWWAVTAALGAASMHAFAYVVVKKHGASVHPLTLNTLPMLVAGACLTLLGAFTETPDLTPRAVVATVHLGLVASVLGLVGYFWLLQRVTAVAASFVFVLFPLVAQIVAVRVEHVPFGLRELTLTLVIALAFTLTQLAGRRPLQLSAR